MVSMNKLSPEKRAAVIACLVEGNSIRATVRMTGVAKNTVTKLLVDLGTVCSIHQDRLMRDLSCERIQCDEIWSFVGMKAKTVPVERRGEYGIGDVWTWVAIDPDTKLVPTWLVWDRGPESAIAFMVDLAGRLANRIQLTTDGHAGYADAVDEAFRGQVDYAMLMKEYGSDPKEERRFSPPVVLSERRIIVNGNPDPDRISTSYVERQNLTMRMGMRRFTRLTNAFSKKVENHAAMVSLHFLYYNFGRPHGSLGKLTTPAMAAGLSDHVWTCDEIAGLLD